MIGVIVAGAFGAQACHAANTRAACDGDRIQLTPNTRTVASGNTPILNSVATPKLPPPPPRLAQNKSGSDAAFACSVRAWLSTTVTCCRVSQVRPCDRASSPWPPPVRWPETPTVGQLPACTARPCAASAE